MWSCAIASSCPVDSDAQSDALMHAFTSDGTRHMEYARTQGSFDDLPLDRILTALDQPTAAWPPARGLPTTPSLLRSTPGRPPSMHPWTRQGASA
jgi:hypothetical protein